MKILIHAWLIHKVGKTFFLPYTHWVYLNEIAKYYTHITIIAPVKREIAIDGNLISISDIQNLEVVELPYSSSYIGSIKHFFAYLKNYSRLSKLRVHDVVYVRYPTPFGWLQRFFFKKSKRILHFVGDPIDATKSNPNLGRLKKFILTSLFVPEHLMYMRACKGAKVFTNGFHLAEKLKKFNIHATSLISSTLNEKDFHINSEKIIDAEAPRLLYVGYLRKSKGVETILYAYENLRKVYPDVQLTIVGSGELENHLKQTVERNRFENVHFTGHIDDRNKLNEIYRSHDIFCFASFSEGSPRVILEAMANNICIVSTPVGSLPQVFEDGEDLIFAGFNDPLDFSRKIELLIEDHGQASKIRRNSFLKAKENTIESFLKKIFYEA